MSQGEDDYDEEALQRLTLTIAGKIGEGARKTDFLFSSACINKVPEELRKLKESAYTPRLVAIGPLHRNDQRLQTHMHDVKLSYTWYLLSRLVVGIEDQESEQIKLKVLQECVAEMKISLDYAKKCYAEEVMLDEEMMLVDGCFILEFLYRCRSFEGREIDVIFGNSLTFRDVQNDLVLLENQIPLFVLEKLFHLTLGRILNRPDKNWSLTDYVLGCYGDKMSPIGTSTKTWCSPRDCCLWVFGNKPENSTTAKNEVLSAHEYYHILHNLHDRYLPRDQTKQKPPREVILMPSASELYFAGVEFVPDAGDSLFKVKFMEPRGLFWWGRRTRFNIPPLAIFDHTEMFLRNLVAFEQSCPGIPEHVSNYAILMGMLVNSDTDVRLLEKAGVVRNYLGPTEDVTNLFKNLSKETFVTESFFADACREATEYSKCFWPKHLARLRRAFFANPGPWQCVALWVSFIALVVSFLQFFTDFIKNGECGCQGTKRWG